MLTWKQAIHAVRAECAAFAGRANRTVSNGNVHLFARRRQTMSRIAPKFGLPLTLLGVGAAAMLGTSPCARAQVESQSSPAVKEVMPPASDNAPAALPAVLPSQPKEGAVQPKDAPTP